MKKIVALLLALMMCLCFTACGDKVEDIEVNGESVAVTDFLAEHLGTYVISEGFTARQKAFEDATEQAANGFTVTRVIEIVADDLGENQISVHFLAVKADCDWALDENNLFSNTLLLVDYETGEVYDEFSADESWLEMNGTKEQQIYYMLHGALVGEGYDGGTIIVDSETRTELSEKDIATINASLYK